MVKPNTMNYLDDKTLDSIMKENKEKVIVFDEIMNHEEVVNVLNRRPATFRTKAEMYVRNALLFCTLKAQIIDDIKYLSI